MSTVRPPLTVGIAAVAAIAAAAVVAAALLLASEAEAAALIARVDAVSKGTGPAAVTSWAGKVRIEMRSPITRRMVTLEERVFHLGPATTRVEVRAADVPPLTVVSDGRSAVVMTPGQPPRPATIPVAAPLSATPASLLQDLAADYSAKLVGTSVIAGRQAKRVELRLRPHAERPARLVSIAIDEQLDLLLSGEAHDEGGLWIRWEFVEFSVETLLDPGLFVVPALPVGSGSADLTPTTDPWQVAAARVSFTLYSMPAEIGRLRSGVPTVDPSGRQVTTYLTPLHGEETVLVVQHASPGRTLAGEAIRVGNDLVYYHLASTGHSLRFDRGGTRIQILAPLTVAKGQLLAIASVVPPQR